MDNESATPPPAPRVTLRHATADATFAARLARDLLNMYGEETVRLVGPTEPSADTPDLAAAPESDQLQVVILSPEALASGEIDGALRSNAPLITAMARECDIPAALNGHRSISFAADWRYDLALAELLDAIRLGGNGSTPDASGGIG